MCNTVLWSRRCPFKRYFSVPHVMPIYTEPSLNNTLLNLPWWYSLGSQIVASVPNFSCCGTQSSAFSFEEAMKEMTTFQ